MSRTLVSVAVPTPLRRAFDYLLPSAEAPPLAAGMRVRVSLGKREIVGIVEAAPRVEADVDARRYKPVEEVLDAAPLLPPETMALCRFASDYYQHALGEVLATALPGPLRRGGKTKIKARGDESAVLEAPPSPTAEQEAVLRALAEKPQGFSVCLLEGVTGSGKTEIYLRRIARVVESGEQALVLVPEIGLTPQLIDRFTRRLGTRVAAFHSGMTEAQRTQTWLRARAGEVGVVIGTRSAVFVPFAKLGLVVVDEEHDTSYKQQDGLRYSARDLSIWRAHQAGIPVILGSATPSLESLHNARSGRYRHLHLKRRATSEAPPPIRVLDVRTRPLSGGLSAPLLEAVGQHVTRGGQVLLFMNRRGYAPTLICGDCGWIAECKRCDARLSLHRYGTRLICHHCGAQSPAPKSCTSCKSENLGALGQGTERIEEALREKFPETRIERMDSDRLAKAGELDRLLGDIRAGAIQIIVGTQVLAKGHDFAKLSLVGIVSADQALYGTDFRALERMGQLVTQVAGRAGRSSGNAAEVILQTREPSHPMLQLLLARGYAGLCDALLEERQAAQMPPFAHLALLRAESVTPAAAMEFLTQAKAALPASKHVHVWEPVPAPMERRAGRYRAQLLLQSTTRPALQALLAAAVPRFEELPSVRKARWSVDVDPADLF